MATNDIDNRLIEKFIWACIEKGRADEDARRSSGNEYYSVIKSLGRLSDSESLLLHENFFV